MIQHQKRVIINAPPDTIFSLIDHMPNKFPVYAVLETKPIIFLRVLLVDGFHSAREAASMDAPMGELILNPGDAMGPFTLTEKEPPHKYWFHLKSLFFDCMTGYSLCPEGDATILNFDLIADNPTFFHKVYWRFIKPFHCVLANKALKNIKKSLEKNA